MDELEKYDVNAFLMLCPDKTLRKIYRDMNKEMLSNPPGCSRNIYLTWAICDVRDRLQARGVKYRDI